MRQKAIRERVILLPLQLIQITDTKIQSNLTAAVEQLCKV